MATVNALNIGAVTLPGGGYPPLSAFKLPVRTGLTGLFLLGNGLALSSKNYAGGADAELVGSPVDGGGFVSLSPASFIQTDVAETLDFSIFTIGRKPSGSPAGEAVFVGNFGVGQVGTSIYTVSGLIQYNVDRTPTGGTTGSVTSNAAAFGLYSVRATAAGVVDVFNHTTTNGSISPNVNPRAATGAGPFRIGTMYGGSSFTSNPDMNMVMIYNRKVSDAERTVIADWARGYAAECGITV